MRHRRSSHHVHLRATCGSIALLLVLLPFSAAQADSSTATAAGAAGALGLTAATGKTTVAAGSGVGEASLLVSEAFGKAGAIIAQLVRTQVSGKPVLLLKHDELIDLSGPSYISGRIDRFSALLTQNSCTLVAPKGEGGGGGVKPAPSDIGAALATDTSIAPISLALDDRILVTAIAMSRSSDENYHPSVWRDESGVTAVSAPAPGSQPDYLIPSEMVLVPTGAPLMKKFQDLLDAETNQRSCDKAKSVLQDIDAFAKTITTPPDKGGASQLGNAILFEDAVTKKADILRVSVEQAGGTSITRANIWYTLGFPGASVVSANLLASFRLTDGASNKTIVSGFVRCAISPVDIENVPEKLSSSSSGYTKAVVTCSYLAPN